ncbi:hypothetical protein [Lewinella sp. IMCC34183]|uniref:hypothetical protein n=1 Tax=Lewinella sp. IMCC34183 TaxID=2248762 RepID=UPI0013003E3F|nr:hypothetical protein [Lewinella sp. IMCC34183]
MLPKHLRPRRRLVKRPDPRPGAVDGFQVDVRPQQILFLFRPPRQDTPVRIDAFYFQVLVR